MPLLPRCVMLAGYAGMCPCDQLALFSFDNLTHASGFILILQLVSGWLCCPRCVAFCMPSLLRCVLLAGHAGMCPSDYPELFSVAQHTTHASGSLLILQLVSEWLAARHVVYVMCPCCPDVCCWLAMLACAPLTSLLCFLSPNSTHASGSLYDFAAGE